MPLPPLLPGTRPAAAPPRPPLPCIWQAACSILRARHCCVSRWLQRNPDTCLATHTPTPGHRALPARQMLLDGPHLAGGTSSPATSLQKGPKEGDLWPYRPEQHTGRQGGFVGLVLAISLCCYVAPSPPLLPFATYRRHWCAAVATTAVAYSLFLFADRRRVQVRLLSVPGPGDGRIFEGTRQGVGTGAQRIRRAAQQAWGQQAATTEYSRRLPVRACQAGWVPASGPNLDADARDHPCRACHALSASLHPATTLIPSQCCPC